MLSVHSAPSVICDKDKLSTSDESVHKHVSGGNITSRIIIHFMLHLEIGCCKHRTMFLAPALCHAPYSSILIVLSPLESTCVFSVSVSFLIWICQCQYRATKSIAPHPSLHVCFVILRRHYLSTCQLCIHSRACARARAESATKGSIP